jgi:mono/diheme cytochrome c family protein
MTLSAKRVYDQAVFPRLGVPLAVSGIARPKHRNRVEQFLHRGALLATVALLVAAGPGTPAPGDSPVDFNRDVRPILANHCLLCHGPDAKNRKGDLRLDRREGALADRGGYAAVVPGKPDKSELFRRVSSKDSDEVMPPSKTGKKLTKVQVDLLRRWIAEGAEYAPHWSFVKPARPALPAVSDPKWPRNEIDRFLLSRLEKEGLKPSPQADPYALVRRVTLDLTGLPPALEDVDRFVKDADPAAYENLVDRLLKSPGFGERWAKVWLDLARYADSQGYAEDRPRTIWLYRDWVIRALNDNLPYDRFTLEQLAGDLLPNPTELQLQATAFHRNTLTNTEGGTDDEEFRNAAIVDRVNTTLQVWMGLTVNCAQCHDHKYDPITQEEFYRLFAFLNQTEDNDAADDRPFLSIYTEEQKRQKKRWEDDIARLEAELKKDSPELDAARKRWEEALAGTVAWSVLRPAEAKSSGPGPIRTADDGSVVAEGGPGAETYTLRALPQARSVTALRLESLGPGRGPDGGFILSRLSLSLAPSDARGPEARFVRVELPGKQKMLHVAEVQVLSGGENAALKGKASQSSTDFGGEAKRAIDGNTNGDYFAANSVTHTAVEENPWWEVDLGKALPVDRVVLWNRTDGGNEIMARIKGFRIKLLDEARKPVQERKVDTVPSPKEEWRIDGVREVAFRAVHAPRGYGANYLLANSNPAKNGWSVDPKAGKEHEVLVALEKPLSFPAGSALLFRLEHGSGAPLGRFRLSVTDDAAAAAGIELPDDVRAILAKPAAGRSKDEGARVAAYHRTVAPELAPTRDGLASVRKQLEALKPSATVPVLRELAEGRRRKTHVQERGNFLVKGKEVSEGVPSILPPLPEGAPRNRLGLALWLVHPDNPLTARVAVNRTWEQIFGQGLVTTSEDWGVRGELPTHPELLDWLATEFVRLNWDVKALIRLLVTSAAYRQSSAVTPAMVAKDPSNRLLGRGPRVRLPAEDVRDQALAAAGLLSSRVGGPSVYPYRPKMGLNAAFSSSLDWETSKGEDRFRRALYTFWRRSIPYPSMATFDAPDRNVCTIRRVATNTPLQALVTLNDPVYVEAAQGLARKIAAEGGAGARERAAYGFRRCLARPPREAEIARLVALYEEARARYLQDPAKAKAMATDPLGPAPEGADLADLAAWTVVSNVLLNLDELFLKR